jgi:dienelactone hydrolase
MNPKTGIIQGKHGPIATSLFLPKHHQHTPLVIFSHGFKGFKDWGHWPLLGQAFSEKGYAFLSFNFSQNGTTPQHPTEIVDLEAFGHNTYSKELDDLQTVVAHARSQLADVVDTEALFLLGHSRGGGISLLAAAADPNLKGVCTWAGVGTLLRFSRAELEEWQKAGVLHVPNSRTGQLLPLYLDLLEDYHRHIKHYQLAKVAQSLQMPYLQIHGTEDTTVQLDEARSLRIFNYRMQSLEIVGANHTLGGAHPWTEAQLPPHSQQALEATLAFYGQCRQVPGGAHSLQG